MFSMTSKLTRRGLVAAIGTAAAAPAAAFAAANPQSSPMQRLWRDAEALRVQLDVHRDAISAAAQDGGIPGWMRLGQEANRLGEERYAKLVAILNGAPQNQADLTIMAKAALDDDIRYGGVTWAGEQLARATIGFSAAA
jgi:hypothetical protein